MSSILVVDDSATVRDDVANFLRQHSLNVVTANDGREGLQQLQANNTIKLVICDVNMPHMDGLTMVEKSRGELRSQVPIIMLTTENCPKMKERGKAAGVKGWIVKPFNGPGILGAIQKLMAS
ncbi:two-component system response regulator [Pseudohongiella acticola]|uniref:Two-component system response regulator n=1 Tax=Pseudohongiella acticola TaxID=1524254 RepID=A0A1E8CKW5_9GAMM|nr:response regulator [Pseudohongiella acticola]OFE13100.1 two-component system response regulator [Pseudohongiella acticola]